MAVTRDWNTRQGPNFGVELWREFDAVGRGSVDAEKKGSSDAG